MSHQYVRSLYYEVPAPCWVFVDLKPLVKYPCSTNTPHTYFLLEEEKILSITSLIKLEKKSVRGENANRKLFEGFGFSADLIVSKE